MASGIYAIAHIGHLKLYVGEASCIKNVWPSLLAQLDNGIYPNTTVQTVWDLEGGKRRFTFHTWKDLANQEIIGLEKAEEDFSI
jgi:hypothetical protein